MANIPDQQIIESVVAKWMREAGAGITIQITCQMIGALVAHHGDNVTISGVCDALDRLSKTALEIQAQLKKAQSQ